MSLGLALNNALSGLQVNQQALSVLSQNVANVNTPGYSRQVISQSAVSIEGQGSGVQIDDITRKIDSFIQRSVIAQASNNSQTEQLEAYYERLQALLGRPGAGNSIDNFLTGFANALQQLAATPESNSLKSSAVSSATTLARQISGLAASVYDLRFEADGQIAESVQSVNGILDRLNELNSAVKRAKSLNQPATGLLDERDRALEELSKFVNITITYGAAGEVAVSGGGGIALLEEGARRQLRYVKSQSLDSLVQNVPFNALEVVSLNPEGQIVGTPQALISQGSSENVTVNVSSGTFLALQQIRDQKFPGLLDQLDQLASRLRDATNAIHNNGSGYPPATVLTGDRFVRPGDEYNWSGRVRIAVLEPDGSSIPSPYVDENYTAFRPLTIDLEQLDSGSGKGKPSVQSIIDEINNHFSTPRIKAKVGDLNNIRLASDTQTLPSGSISLFDFDLDTENITEGTVQVFVDSVTVLDDAATNITNVTRQPPSFTIQPTNSYTTTSGSADVTITLSQVPTGIAAGDKIYLNAPSLATVNGITAANLTGYFTVTAVSGNQITFTAGAAATSSGAVSDATNVQAFPPYDRIEAGATQRTRNRGQLQLDLSGNLTSSYYDITVNVSVIGEDGVVRSAPITYRVGNNQTELYNRRYDAVSISGAGTIVQPLTTQSYARAIMVDANGRELPTVNGKYTETPGYLKIVAGNPAATYSIAIDELDSKQLGKLEVSPAEPGTNRGFSHFFGLNNLFKSNQPITTGDTVRNSAYFMQVEDRIQKNANLITTGNLVKESKGGSTGGKEVYTYVRYSGDNTVIQKLGKVNTNIVNFDAAGTLPTTALSLQSYASQILGVVAQQSAEAIANADNAQTLYNAFKSKSEAISGVNLDEELANTVVLQNAYTANARIITVVNKMYDDLIQVI